MRHHTRTRKTLVIVEQRDDVFRKRNYKIAIGSIGNVRVAIRQRQGPTRRSCRKRRNVIEQSGIVEILTIVFVSSWTSFVRHDRTFDKDRPHQCPRANWPTVDLVYSSDILNVCELRSLVGVVPVAPLTREICVSPVRRQPRPLISLISVFTYPTENVLTKETH